MRRMACIVFEVKEGENFAEVLRQLLDDPKIANEAKFMESKANLKVMHIAELDAKSAPNISKANLTWEDKYKSIMSKLGIDMTYKGYNTLYYVIEAIALNPKYRRSFKLKELYAHVTQNTGAAYAVADRRIRTLVEAMYNHNSREYVNEVLNTTEYLRENITNRPFIVALSKVIFE